MAMVGLDRFTGTGNPDDWIFRIERYFVYLGFSENDWLSLPFFYLDCEALDWFCWMSQQTILELEAFQGKVIFVLSSTNYPRVAIDSATKRVREEITSSLGDGQSSIANNFEVHLETFDTLIDTNLLLARTNFFMGDEHSDHADQVFDESSHQIEDSVHEFDMAFDLVADKLVGLQIPLQVTQVISKPMKSIVEEDKCVETKTDIVFYKSLQQNEFDLQFQFIDLQLVSSLANFGDLAMCESVTDGLPTCHWFDTGSMFLRSFHSCSGLQSMIIIYLQQNLIRMVIVLLLVFKILSRYILAIELGNSKMDQVLDAMSLPGVVLNKTPKEMGTVQQFHFKDRACFLISFGGRDCIVLAAHSSHALPMRYFDANSLYSVLSRYKSDFVASRDMYVATIFVKPTILEDLYLHKLFFENKGDVSKR
ncbi:hypothetical protein H5410_005583 [Solanum commersonii]|uniref:Uncharacterized protein n=1 Tax=Solanum commersonii TaxID=4109 RepID=A0A9J6A701_SOLCO|nr:hypothetical protein H5410_005583 [Solanum commersonii]